MSTVVMEQRKRIHPHKFTLWVGIASIIMMFAGLTSAYIVKRNQANWTSFDIPRVFWYSTAVIIISSVTLLQALKVFRQRNMMQYRRLMLGTLLLGVLFVGLQLIGFKELWDKGMTLQANVSFSFLYIIVGLHALHVLGGIIALSVMALRSFSTKVKSYDAVPVEVVGTYWHFVDFLWIYLLIFLILIR